MVGFIVKGARATLNCLRGLASAFRGFRYPGVGAAGVM